MTMITPSYLGETIEYSSLHACRSTLEDPIASPLNAYTKATQLAAILLLDQSGTEKLFGSAKSFAEKLRTALRALQFPSNVAVAPNAEASLLLARSYAGVTCVDENDVQSKLAPLPLTMLRCEAPLLATLARWGIRNLRELAALPEAALARSLSSFLMTFCRSVIGSRGKSVGILVRFGLAEPNSIQEPAVFRENEGSGM